MFQFAPATAKFWLKIRLVRLGRGDAKRYAGALDSTPTHTTLLIQSLVHAGQHRVNGRYLELARQLSQSIEVTSASMLAHQDTLDMLKSQSKELHGRLLDKNLMFQSAEVQKLEDLANQLASNEKHLAVLAVEAQAALDSWASYFQLLASIYLRQRMKLKGKGISLEADMPVYQGVPLAEIPAKSSIGGE